MPAAASAVTALRRLLAATVVTGALLAGAACTTIPRSVPASAGCSLAPTDGLERIEVPGGRSYLLYTPDGLSGREDVGVPLLVSLHGLNSDAAQMSGYTGWQADADARGYVVVYPDSTDGSWEIADDSPDVAFVRSVVADVASRRCIDPTRVHATGHSLGAYMAQRLACDANDVVASVTEYAGGPTTLGGFGCDLDRPVAVGLYHGERDRVVFPLLGRASRDEWVVRNGCDPSAIAVSVTDGTYLRYEGCDAGVVVIWRSYPNQGHLWPTGTRRAEMLDRMWELFDAHTL